MRKLFAALLSLLILGACAGPFPADAEALPLPNSGDINWNAISPLFGRAARSEPFAVPYTTESFYIQQQSEEVTMDLANGMPLRVYEPDLSCLSDEGAASAIYESLRRVLDEHILKIENVELPYVEGHERHADAYIYFSSEYVSGYISITLERYFYSETYTLNQNGYEVYDDNSVSEYAREALCFDALTGQRLELSDLFYSDVCFTELLNPLISEKLSGEWYELKRPFRGLPENFNDFSLSSSYLVLLFPLENPYVTYQADVQIPLWELRSALKLEVPETPVFKEETFAVTEENPYPPEIAVRVMENTDYVFRIFHPDDGADYVSLYARKGETEAVKRINARLLELSNDIFGSDFYKKAKELGYDYVQYECYVYANVLSFSARIWYVETQNRYDFHEYTVVSSFDIEDGRELYLDDIIVSEEKCFESLSGYESLSIPGGFSENLPVALFSYGATFVWGDRYYYIDTSAVNPDIWRNIK